jgi:predicted outer membrane protein
MRRLWFGATGIVMLAACRSEGTNDRALGTERTPESGIFTAQASRGGSVGSGEKSPAQSAERRANGIARILVMTQAIAEGEIEMAKLVQERSASPDVKAYAAKLSSEHQQELDATTHLAQSKRINLGAVDDDPLIKARRAASREKMDRLARLSSDAFDEAYMEGKPNEHALLSALTRQGEELSKDNELGAFFRMVGEHAQDHRTRALKVQPKLCASSAGAQVERGVPGGPRPRGELRERGQTAPQGAPPSPPR